MARLDAGRLPWEGSGEKARPGTRLYYQLVLGTIGLEAAVARLMAVYADTRVERHTARGEAVLAVILVDRQGRPIDEPVAAVSSFGWALPKALAGELDTLGSWQTAEQKLVQGLDRVIRHEDEEGNVRALNGAMIREAFDWLDPMSLWEIGVARL